MPSLTDGKAADNAASRRFLTAASSFTASLKADSPGPYSKSCALPVLSCPGSLVRPFLLYLSVHRIIDVEIILLLKLYRIRSRAVKGGTCLLGQLTFASGEHDLSLQDGKDGICKCALLPASFLWPDHASRSRSVHTPSRSDRTGMSAAL